MDSEAETHRRRLAAMETFHLRHAAAYRQVGKIEQAETAERMAREIREKLAR
jgi:hypothetical protein